MILIASGFIAALVILVAARRKLQLRNDHVLNPAHDPFLAFAETQRSQGKQMFDPWTATDPELLSIAKTYFPAIPIPFIEQLGKPDLTPVKITIVTNDDYKKVTDQTEYIIAVGGPPAAMLAFQAAKIGSKVLYVNNNDVIRSGRKARPIWAGAANHIEPDVLTEAPAFISGHHPLQFIWNEARRFLNPVRYDNEVLRDDYPWLTLNISDWLRQPRQIPAGLRVAWGNYLLAHRRPRTMHAGVAVSGEAELSERTHDSRNYLEAFNRETGRILRAPRGSLIAAPDQAVWNHLLKDREILSGQGSLLNEISLEEAQSRHGIKLRNTVGVMEKVNDVILEPSFQDTVCAAMKSHGCEVNTDWHLNHIMVERDNSQHGIMEFCQISPEGIRTFHYRKFSHAYLSLGSTMYDPDPYDMVSVTGVSINALVFNARFSGGPLVCGGSGNHVAVVPLAAPETINGQDVSFIRIAAGGCVGPRNRDAGRWYTYSGQTAVNALSCLRKTLPEDAEIRVLSVIGCNRLIGRDGRQVEINPYIRVEGRKIPVKSITIQVGAGGGGLTQMGALAKKINTDRDT